MIVFESDDANVDAVTSFAGTELGFEVRLTIHAVPFGLPSEKSYRC